MGHPYEIYDVFTAERLKGNPLAVVHGADDLDADAMQAIAREFNLAETIFVSKPAAALHSARVRIFTPKRELPFAGHPTVGAAVALARAQGSGASGTDAVIVLEEEIGPVRCLVSPGDGSGAGFAEFDCPVVARMEDAPMPAASLAASIGLDPSRIGFENHRPTISSAGVRFLCVPLADLAAMSDVRAAATGAGEAETLPLYLYCRETMRHDADFHARMFASGFGIEEDPATGSAAAALAASIAHFDALPDGHYQFRIEQGVEMGRASLIRLSLQTGEGRLTAMRIGGEAVRIARGELEL